MTLEAIFSSASILAMTGWAVLLLSPWLKRVSQIYAGLVVPIILSVGYTSLILVYWFQAEGGYSSMADVAALFETPGLLVAGWIHYLAFDLFIGAWQVRQANRRKLPFWLIIPCLVLTFLFGPVGLLCFLAIRVAMPRPARQSHA